MYSKLFRETRVSWNYISHLKRQKCIECEIKGKMITD